MKFCSLVLELHLPQNFCHTHTDRHFPKIVKSCSGHPKTCKSIENRKSKICTKPILSSICIEESKKRRRRRKKERKKKNENAMRFCNKSITLPANFKSFQISISTNKNDSRNMLGRNEFKF